MPEQQNIEDKQSWHDDYLKCVCGFANAHGGTVYIGKDDRGVTVGVADHKKLMDDLPNKIRDVLGIMAEVNLHDENGLYFIEIVTPPYSAPISLSRQLLLPQRLDQTGIKGQRADGFSAAKIRQNLG